MIIVETVLNPAKFEVDCTPRTKYDIESGKQITSYIPSVSDPDNLNPYDRVVWTGKSTDTQEAAISLANDKLAELNDKFGDTS